VAVWRWWNGVQGHHPGKKEIVERKQQEAWRARLLKTAKGPFYLNCKKQWGMDPSLHQHGSRSGRVWKTRMKASAVPLQAELMREHRAQTDVCGMCKLGVPEHQQHMMMECTAYEEERKKMEAGIATGDALSAEEARALLEVGRSARAAVDGRTPLQPGVRRSCSSVP
jgi:hypothetical protein